MENKIGYAVIPTEEYINLIEENKDRDKTIAELKTINSKFEKAFINKLLKNEEYHLENIKECNMEDYHYQELSKCFLKIGIKDIEYIDEKIRELKDKFDKR